MSDMPIRIMQFEFDEDALKASIPNLHFELGLSMTLPYLEPYLIRTMRESLKQTTDTSVASDVKQFIGQEAQHFRQHRVLNDMLRNCDSAYAGLQAIEDEMEADYQRYTKTKSLKFNLAYAEGFEAATCALARNVLKHGDLDGGSCGVGRLLSWHLTEEIEHRTVTFNIYDHLFGSYFYRLFIGIYAQYHFFGYVFRFARFIKDNQPEQGSASTATTAEHSARPKGVVAALALLGSLLSTYLPWYNPANIKLPNKISELSSRYTEEALETRLPQ